MVQHQILRRPTARRGGRCRQRAQTTKTRILREVGEAADTTRIRSIVVDRRYHREAGFSREEDGDSRTVVGSEADFVDGEEDLRRLRRWRRE
jgi:hypothetical protein